MLSFAKKRKGAGFLGFTYPLVSALARRKMKGNNEISASGSFQESITTHQEGRRKLSNYEKVVIIIFCNNFIMAFVERFILS